MLSARSSGFCRYEKAVIELGNRRGRSGWNGWLRADKEAGDAGEGGTRRCAFRSSRLGLALSRRAVHAANYVRFSRLRVDGLARRAEARNENTHRGGKGSPASPYFWKMATWRTIKLQLR